jgi:lipopolysaccharide export LptBFGC system permease protein LptF
MATGLWAATIGQTKEVTMNRKLLWAVLVIGFTLVIAPLAIGLPGKGALLILLAGTGLFGSTLRGRIAFHHHARPTHA